jgi:hypothetical protein
VDDDKLVLGKRLVRVRRRRCILTPLMKQGELVGARQRARLVCTACVSSGPYRCTGHGATGRNWGRCMTPSNKVRLGFIRVLGVLIMLM